MKTTKEKGEEWGCSARTVAQYCATGLIPPADKIGRFRAWAIPDKWPKPPMRRHALCFLLDTVDQLHLGVTYNDLHMGYSREEVRDGYAYLISAGFMTSIDLQNYEKELYKAIVTSRGADLINADNEAQSGNVKFTAHAKAIASLGLARVEIGCEASNE